jgi:hypothetical protein
MSSSFYRPLDVEKDYAFFHPKAPVPEAALSLIRPLDEGYCRSIWSKYVRSAVGHWRLLENGTWVHDILERGFRFRWVDDWNKGEHERVSEFLGEHVGWPDDTKVFLLWGERTGIETTWRVFLDNWISFLFEDEWPILLTPDDSKAIVFAPGANLYIGERRNTEQNILGT